MWTTVYIATEIENAQNIERKLTNEGFMVRIKFLANENGLDLYEVLAPEFEVVEIQECMIELGIV